MAIGTRSIHRQIRRFSWICGSPPISLRLVYCQFLFMPRVDLGVLLLLLGGGGGGGVVVVRVVVIRVREKERERERE